MGGGKTLFPRQHELEFGLKVEEVHPTTSVVVSVYCQFYVVFAREKKAGANHEEQHRSRWEEYRSLDNEKRLNYFKNNVRNYVEDMGTFALNLLRT